VKLYDGATLLGSVMADSAGAWGYTTAPLANGGHSLTATATDLAGNTSAPSSVFNATIDTIAPTAVITGKLALRGYVVLTGTSEPNSTVSVYDAGNNKLVATVTAAADGTWSFAKSGLNVKNFMVSAVDAAGNSSNTPNPPAPSTPVISS